MVACSANSPDLEHPIQGLEQIFREYRALYESYTPTDARYLTLHKGHLMFVRPEEGRFVTADLIRTLTSSGTAPLKATIGVLS
jgi:hypothetical protein